MIGQEQLKDLHALLREWVASHCEVSSLSEAEELAEQLARVAGSATLEATVPGLARSVGYEGSWRACGCGD